MKLNEDTVKALPVPERGNKVHFFAGAKLQGTKTPRGFGVRITANGARSFVLNYRSKHVERRITIGQWPTWSVLKAVREARQLRQRIDRGEDPLADRRKQEASQKDTLGSICDEYFSREGSKLRSAKARRRALERLVMPVLGNRDIASIKRSDIIRLLDGINDANGRVMANRIKAYVSKIFTWHAGRSDDFRSPIVRGMPYSSADEKPRQRVLGDDEVLRVWAAATGPFGALVRFILTTGARRSEACLMGWDELTGEDWLLPSGRNKTGLPLLRPLSRAALAVLPPVTGRFVFTNNGRAPIGAGDKSLKALQEASGTSGWTLHDLRRTARTLMSRAQVPVDHAERCLGHVIGGIRATYDLHEYRNEKAAAYRALGALIERIVDPPPCNVTQLRSAS
jgi:integrase